MPSPSKKDEEASFTSFPCYCREAMYELLEDIIELCNTGKIITFNPSDCIAKMKECLLLLSPRENQYDECHIKNEMKKYSEFQTQNQSRGRRTRDKVEYNTSLKLSCHTYHSRSPAVTSSDSAETSAIDVDDDLSSVFKTLHAIEVILENHPEQFLVQWLVPLLQKFKLRLSDDTILTIVLKSTSKALSLLQVSCDDCTMASYCTTTYNPKLGESKHHYQLRSKAPSFSSSSMSPLQSDCKDEAPMVVFAKVANNVIKSLPTITADHYSRCSTIILRILDCLITYLQSKRKHPQEINDAHEELEVDVLDYLMLSISQVSSNALPEWIRIMLQLLLCDNDLDESDFDTFQYKRDKNESWNRTSPSLTTKILVSIRQQLQQRISIPSPKVECSDNHFQHWKEHDVIMTRVCMTIYVFMSSLGARMSARVKSSYMKILTKVICYTHKRNNLSRNDSLEGFVSPSNCHKRPKLIDYISNPTKTTTNPEAEASLSEIYPCCIDVLQLDLMFIVFFLLSDVNFNVHTKRLIYDWISKNMFPFDTLRLLVSHFLCCCHVCTGNTNKAESSLSLSLKRTTFLKTVLTEDMLQLLHITSSRMASDFIQVSFLLLLCPTRVDYTNETIQFSTTTQTREFILLLFEYLPKKHRSELARGILHLSEQISSGILNWKTSAFSLYQTEKPSSTKAANKNCILTELSTPANSMKIQKIISQEIDFLLSSLVSLYTADMTQYKAIFIRLICSPHHNTNTTRNGSNQAVHSADSSFASNCSLLVRLYEQEASTVNCIESSQRPVHQQLISLIQTMLFASNITRSQRSTSEIQSVLRGIHLATIVIQSNCFSSNDKHLLKNWIKQIILPSTRRMVSPEVGLFGLSFLKTWHEHVAPLKNDLFENVQQIVSATGLIQKNVNISDKEFVFLFHKSEKTFGINSTCNSESLDLAFCLNYFLQCAGDLGKHPSQWMHSIDWIFDLCNTYLQLGLANAMSWNPNRWLLSNYIFPAVLVPNENCSNKVAAASEWLQRHLCQMDELQNNVKSTSVELIEVVHELASLSIHQVWRLRESLYRFRLALLMAGTLSAAVLQNACRCFAAMKSDRDDSLPLIKLQLSRIFLFKDKGDFLDTVLLSLANAIRRRVKFSSFTHMSSNEPQLFVNQSVLEGKPSSFQSKEYDAFISSIFCDSSLISCVNLKIHNSNSFISATVIWKCLMEASDIVDISQHFNTRHHDMKSFFLENDHKYERFSCLLFFKCNMLKLMNALLTVKPCNIDAIEIDKHKFFFCLNETLQTLDVLSKVRLVVKRFPEFENHSVELVERGLEDVVVYYLSLLTSILSINTTECKEWPSSWKDIFMEWLNGCSIGLQQGNIRNHTVEASDHIEAFFRSFGHFLANEKLYIVADGIIEMLSQLALHDPDSMLQQTFELSWQFLQTAYIVRGDESFNNEFSRPCAFVKVLVRMFPSNADEHSRHVKKPNFRPLFNEDYRVIQDCKRRVELLFFRKGLMRHWGLLSESTNSLPRVIHDFKKILGELATCLEKFGNCYSVSDDEINIGERDTQQISKKQKGKIFASTITGLNEVTLTFCFEWMLQLVHATCVISDPACDCNHASKFGPYHCLDQILQVYTMLLHLYITHISWFPKHSSFKVFLSGKEILKTVVDLVYRSMDWRASQPILSHENESLNTLDMGSLDYLKHFVDSISYSIIRPILSLCDVWCTSDVKYSTSLKMSADMAQVTLGKIIASCNVKLSWSSPIPRAKVDHFSFKNNSNPSGPNSKGKSTDESQAIPLPRQKSVTNDIDYNLDSSDDSTFEIYGNGWGKCST